MKDIRFTLTDAPTVVLLGPQPDGIRAHGPLGLRVSGGPKTERVAHLRAEASKLFARGNRSWTATFSAWRTFATIASAEDFAARHPNDMPGRDGMVCAITLHDGSIRYLTTPFATATCAARGLKVDTQYTLSGGQLVADNPAA